MRVIETQATVSPERELTVRTQVPKSVRPGQHHIVVVLEEAPASSGSPEPLNLPRLPVTAWPEDLSLRREDLY